MQLEAVEMTSIHVLIHTLSTRECLLNKLNLPTEGRVGIEMSKCQSTKLLRISRLTQNSPVSPARPILKYTRE